MSGPTQPNMVWSDPCTPSVLRNRTATVTFFEALKLVIPFLLLLPLRLLCIMVALANLWLCCRLCIIGLSATTLDQMPLSQGRQLLLVPARWCLRLFLLGLGYWRINTNGQRSTSARIVIANHMSFVEAVALACSGRACFVSRKENEAIPLVSTALRAFQCISVDRADPGSRKVVAEAIQTRATSPGWPQIVIFPEGTTGNGAGLLTFKLGAFAPLLPVQPCCVTLSYKHFDPSFSIGVSLPGLALRSMAQWYNCLTLDWLEPITPQDVCDLEQGPDPKLFCNHVREVMGKKLAVPLVAESYQDVQLWLEALALKVPSGTRLVPVELAAENFGVDLAGLTILLRRFVKQYGCACRVSHSELLCGLALPEGPLLHELFEAMDVDRDGFISFPDFVRGCHRLDMELSQSRALLLVTNHYSHGGYCILKQDMAASLQLTFSGLQPHHVGTLWQRMASADAAAPAASLFRHAHPLSAGKDDPPATFGVDSIPISVFQSFLVNNPEYFFLLHRAL
eukprot:GGOE01001773.1.p1 GENE.GGOE01001773.1~~GGOE01001773.1.p1  ORF type:complete len:510 (-),score=79.39 GGOE01001773.1:423-1952(-)